MPSIAFFGAIGRSTTSYLAPALQAGYHCTACKFLHTFFFFFCVHMLRKDEGKILIIKIVASSPTELTSTLWQRGLPQSTIQDKLSRISGSHRSGRRQEDRLMI